MGTGEDRRGHQEGSKEGGDSELLVVGLDRGGLAGALPRHVGSWEPVRAFQLGEPHDQTPVSESSPCKLVGGKDGGWAAQCKGQEHRRQKTWKVLWYLGPVTMQLTKGHMPWRGGQETQGAVGDTLTRGSR